MMRAAEILLEYVTRPTGLVYHGSRTRAIQHFEKRGGVRSAWFDTTAVASHGFFFALSPEDALGYGRYVSSYRIRAERPLIFGTDGVDAINDPKRRADIRYVLAGLLQPGRDGDFHFEGATNDVHVRAEHVENNDLDQDDDWIYQFIGTGGIDWEVLDSSVCVTRMRERGYDSTVVYEPSTKSRLSWFVLDAAQVHFVAEVLPAPDDD